MIGDRGLRYICGAIRSCWPEFESLNVQANLIADDGARELGDVLRNHRNLKVLKVGVPTSSSEPEARICLLIRLTEIESTTVEGMKSHVRWVTQLL